MRYKDSEGIQLNEIEKQYPVSIPVSVAAKIIGKPPTYIHQGLIHGRLPFGTAVQCVGGQWSYNIPTLLFMKWIRGEWIERLYHLPSAQSAV